MFFAKIHGLIVSIILFFVAPSFAQEVLDLTYTAKTKLTEGQSPKQALYDKAIQDVSMEHIRGLIGQEKTDRNLTVIQNKILKQSGKYILSMRGDKFDKKGDEYEMAVALKISIKGLRSLLLEQGLLYTMEGPPKLLPVVSFTDRIGARSYGWWYQQGRKDYGFLVDQTEVFHKALRSSLQKIGFFSMAPDVGQYSQALPDIYRNETMARSDYLFMGEFFKSSIVLKGSVNFKLKPETENVYLVDVRIEAWHSGNGRMMAEVVRLYETEPGQFKTAVTKKFEEVASKISEDLSVQLADAWKQGTFGASLLKLAVIGKISPKSLEDFKKDVVLQVRDIKGLRERLIESRKTTFEIDSSSLPQELAQSFRTAKFTRFKVEVEDISSEGLTIKVESL